MKCFWNGQLYKDQRTYECHGNLIQRKARIYAEEKAASKGKMNDFPTSEGG